MKTWSTANVFSSEIMRIRFPWFFRSFNKWVILSRRFWTIAVRNSSFLEHLRLFSPIFLTILDTVEPEVFFCVSLVIFWYDVVFEGLFDDFLAYSLKYSWLTTIFWNSEAFKRSFTQWTVILLTFSCFKISVFRKPVRNQINISTLLPFIRRYLTFSNVL